MTAPANAVAAEARAEAVRCVRAAAFLLAGAIDGSLLPYSDTLRQVAELVLQGARAAAVVEEWEVAS